MRAQKWAYVPALTDPPDSPWGNHGSAFSFCNLFMLKPFDDERQPAVKLFQFGQCKVSRAVEKDGNNAVAFSVSVNLRGVETLGFSHKKNEAVFLGFCLPGLPLAQTSFSF